MKIKPLIITTGIICAFVSACSYTAHYSRNAIITSVKGNSVIATDTTDNIWEFHGDNYKIGDTVKLKIFNNNTDAITGDDKVVKAKICK